MFVMNTVGNIAILFKARTNIKDEVAKILPNAEPPFVTPFVAEGH